VLASSLLFGLSGTAWTIIAIVALVFFFGVIIVTDDLDWFD
jgi:hypothetical protein